MDSYVIKNGDTMWQIAKKHGVSLEELIRANPLVKDPNRIAPGDRIRIPFPENGEEDIHVTENGESLWQIARGRNIPIEDILAQNPQIDTEEPLRPGESIRIPQYRRNGEIKTNNGAVAYVKNGDSFFRIAQRYAVNRDILAAVNPQITDTEHLTPGTQLYLPGFHYTKNGETLHSIAGDYGVAEAQLIKANPQIRDSDTLSVGEKIAIPRRPDGMIAVYTVRPGDTLYKIAQKYNTAVESLLLCNEDIKKDKPIYPDQRLNIPGPHLTQKGQTLPGIAGLYAVSVSALRKANPGIGDDPLRPGQMIRIPQKEKDSCRKEESGIRYIIQVGDTLSAIAELYHVSAEALLRENPHVKNADSVYPGTVLRVPTGFVNCLCHEVRKGESLWKIAASYELRIEHILKANPELTDANSLYPGQFLRIPIRGEDCR